MFRVHLVDRRIVRRHADQLRTCVSCKVEETPTAEETVEDIPSSGETQTGESGTLESSELVRDKYYRSPEKIRGASCNSG